MVVCHLWSDVFVVRLRHRRHPHVALTTTKLSQPLTRTLKFITRYTNEHQRIKKELISKIDKQKEETKFDIYRSALGAELGYAAELEAS